MTSGVYWICNAYLTCSNKEIKMKKKLMFRKEIKIIDLSNHEYIKANILKLITIDVEWWCILFKKNCGVIMIIIEDLLIWKIIYDFFMIQCLSFLTY